jgi:hypothetical protein
VVPSYSGTISKTNLPLKIKYCVRNKTGIALSIDAAVYSRIAEFLAALDVLVDQRGEIDI